MLASSLEHRKEAYWGRLGSRWSRSEVGLVLIPATDTVDAQNNLLYNTYLYA